MKAAGFMIVAMLLMGCAGETKQVTQYDAFWKHQEKLQKKALDHDMRMQRCMVVRIC